jgi:hypothetical protein
MFTYKGGLNKDMIRNNSLTRLDSLISNTSINGNLGKNIAIERGENKWNIEESTPDINTLLAELDEDKEFSQININKNRTYKTGNRRNNNKISISQFLLPEEETKHENEISASIDAEIDQMMLGDYNPISNVKTKLDDDIADADKNNPFLTRNASSTFNPISHEDSNNSEFDRLESFILRDDSKNYDVDEHPKDRDLTPIILEPRSTCEEPEVMYLKNMENQPDASIFNKRKAATQYIPYGVYLKKSEGL